MLSPSETLDSAALQDAATPAPIALFVYNRPEHTRRTIEALRQNTLSSRSDLVVFSDGPKSAAAAAAVEEVRRYVRTVDGFRSLQLHERQGNAGLAKSIIEGVSSVCADAGRVIVLEDDMVTSRWFLQFMNDGLKVYEHDPQVASIHGYSYPTRTPLPATFFLKGADCWGWATWSRAWRHFNADGAALLHALVQQRLEHAFDLDGAYGFTRMLRDQIAGKNDSWAVRWHASCFLAGLLTLYPGHSLVANIGNDASGTHCSDSDDFGTRVASAAVHVERIELAQNEAARRAFGDFLRSTRQGLGQRVLRRVARSFGFA